MDVERFTQNPEVLGYLSNLKNSCKDKEFSDIVDDEGHQYIDLVMEGGGVLGIALVGYTYVLEEMGLRFLRVGGTSAGSINALLVAALGKPQERKSEKLLYLLANLDLNKFVDGDESVRDFVEAMRRGGILGLISKFSEGVRVLDNLWRDMGLNPGQAFQDWLSGALKKEGIHSAQDLGQRMRDLPTSLKKRPKPPNEDEDQAPIFDPKDDFRLALVTADVSTETKVKLPKMASLYWKDTNGIDPAVFVRASMSIPYFFHPLKIARKNMPSWKDTKANWKEWAGYDAELPKECVFIDGGIMSNFPIDLFHKADKVPAAPTFGAKLGLDGRRSNVGHVGNLTWAIFNSARHCLDYDFIIRNPDYNKLLTYIDTEDYDWLDFDMSEEDRIGLFSKGVEAAARFLETFEWKKYKEIREKTAAVAAFATELEAADSQ